MLHDMTEVRKNDKAVTVEVTGKEDERGGAGCCSC